MSASVALRAGLVSTLKADLAVSAMVADRVFDNVPEGAIFPYLSLGASDVVPRDAECVTAREETVQIDAWSRRSGKRMEVLQLVDAVKTAVHWVDLDLGTFGLVSLRVVVMRVLDEPDGVTVHGVVQVTALIEE